ncbi:MAG: NADH-quinone oxidoreductase subunit C [Proteobacteria bacterium]|nr:MAG: NADH-quinone oxidoreductase subunit C [Pseudomonadota bacterium]
MADAQKLAEIVGEVCGEVLQSIVVARGETTVEIAPEHVIDTLKTLRDHADLAFEQLVDVCGVDYTTYGTDSQAPEAATTVAAPHLAVVYHLLSLTHNHRIRVRARLDPERPVVDSVVDLWPVANWFEREAFDLFGVVFQGHPDLRRLLTDYGFIGHPFRKDFPLWGHVEMRYDEKKGRVVYEPMSIEPRILVPRIRRNEGYRG